MEYGSGGGGHGGVPPAPATARSIDPTDTIDTAWHKHEQMIIMESRQKQHCKYYISIQNYL